MDDTIVVHLMKNAHASVAHKRGMTTFGDLVSKIVGSVFRLASVRNCNVIYIVGDMCTKTGRASRAAARNNVLGSEAIRGMASWK